MHRNEASMLKSRPLVGQATREDSRTNNSRAAVCKQSSGVWQQKHHRPERYQHAKTVAQDVIRERPDAAIIVDEISRRFRSSWTNHHEQEYLCYDSTTASSSTGNVDDAIGRNTTCNGQQHQDEQQPQGRIAFRRQQVLLQQQHMAIEEMTSILQSLLLTKEAAAPEEISLASIATTSFSFSEDEDSCCIDCGTTTILSLDDERRRAIKDDCDDESVISSFTIAPSIDSCQSSITCVHFADDDSLSFLYPPSHPWETLCDEDFGEYLETS